MKKNKFVDLGEPTLADFKERSFAWMIQKYLDETGVPGARVYGHSRGYTLDTLQGSPIGSVLYEDLKSSDFIDHCTKRRADGPLPQTINQDVTYASTVLRHAFEVWEWDECGLKALKKAKAQLKRMQLIGKGPARDRRPTPAEWADLLALAATDDQRPKNQILMLPTIRFQASSCRRISETCRIARKDVDTAKRLCLVRDLKNPKGKGFHAWFPLLGEVWDIVQERLAVIPEHPDARLFPYRSESVVARFVAMKQELGINDLHLHDLRREGISRLFEQGYSVPEVALVSLHRNPTQLLGTYTRLKPESLLLGPASKRIAVDSIGARA